MNQQFIALLYSQYSPNSKRLLDLIQNCSVDLSTAVGLHTVCVDNEEVRARILKSSQIDIQVVPCILMVHPDGGVEKYDGGNAFKWVEEVIQRYAPPPPAPRLQPQVSSTRPPPEHLEQYEPEKSRVKRKQPRRPRPPVQPITVPDEVQDSSTAIEDLEEDDEDDYVPPQRPPAGVRVDPGNYEQGEFGSPEEPNRTIVHGIRDSTQPTKSGKVDIMAAAQAMQKDRDMDFEKQRPVGMSAAR